MRTPARTPAYLMTDQPTVPPQSGLRRQRARAVVANPDPELRRWLRSVLSPLNLEIWEAATGNELEDLVAEAEGEPFALIISSSKLPGPSGLQVLAAARSKGSYTPFIIITSRTGDLVRVFVSDAEGTVLSSRVLDGHNLGVLARGLADKALSTQRSGT